jgi:hypothetical protein
MNGLSGARVLLLDDQPAEALPVILAFSKAGIASVFFDGKETNLPKPARRLRGVRLAILDMNLGVTGSDKTIASTLVQTFGRIISSENGPYGILIWTNHPELKAEVAKYIYDHPTLPKPVFIVMLRKATFRKKNAKAGTHQFAIRRLSGELVKILSENSPLECMQAWEGACFDAATSVTNAISDLSGSSAADLEEWSRMWREEALKLLLAISKASAEEHHALANAIPSIFLALNPLHSDRMDAQVEELASNLAHYAGQIMEATGSSAVERKANVNSMLHLASDRLNDFIPGNLYVFGKSSKPSFIPSLKDALKDCVEGSPSQQPKHLADIIGHGRLCALEVTPVCDYAQNKMGLSRLIVGFAVPWDHYKKVKGKTQFLKSLGPFYLSSTLLAKGAYMLFLNSRYTVTAKPSAVAELRATARVRPQLLADVQSWASYQAARQGVMLLK